MLITLVASVSSASAQETVQSTQPREHVVRRGDTLWDLSRTYLMNPFLWPRLFEANRSVVEDPHWIYPDERLMIPGLVDTLAVPISVTEAELPTQAAAPQRPDRRSRFYQPTPVTREDTAAAQYEVRAREEPYVVAPSEYAAAPWLADTASIGISGQVQRLADPAQVDDRLPSRLHPFDRIYINRLRAGVPAVGDSLLVVGVRDEVPGYGHKVVPLALVVVEEHAENSVIAAVVHQYGEAVAGNMVIPAEARPEMPRGTPEAVTDGPAGSIVAFLEDDPLKGSADQGFIDLGGDQVSLGDILEAYLPAEKAGGTELRAARVARLKVVRTGDQSSTVRVLQVLNTRLGAGLMVRVRERTQ